MLALVSVMFLIGCNAPPAATAVPVLAANTATRLPASTPTSVSTLTPTTAPSSTSTPVPTTVSTAIPTLTATPRPAKIDPGNVAQVHQIASWQGPDKTGIGQVVWSPDGMTVAALQDHKAILWDVASGRVLRTLEGPDHAIDISPDGKLLAGDRDDYTVRLWEVSSGREVRNFGKHSSVVLSVRFSPDGRLLFAGSTYGPQTIWDVLTGRAVGDLDSLMSGVLTSAAFSGDGKVLATGSGGSRGGAIQLWTVPTGDALTSFFDARDDKYGLAFSPDGKLVASGALFGSVKLWDVAARREVSNFQAEQATIRSVAFSPSGELLAAATRYGVHLLRVPDLRELRLITGHTDDVHSAIFSPDGRMLASGSQDSTVKLWGLQP